MERTGWQKTWVRILTTGLTFAVMALIFCFSMEDAEQSNETSGTISREVTPVVYPDYYRKEPAEQLIMYDNVQHVVRKAAHFSEYAILGLMIRLCLESWFGRRRFMLPAAWIAGVLYAATDELHQLRIDGRSGQRSDVMLDSCGVLAGVLAASLILYLWWRKRHQA